MVKSFFFLVLGLACVIYYIHGTLERTDHGNSDQTITNGSDLMRFGKQAAQNVTMPRIYLPPQDSKGNLKRDPLWEVASCPEFEIAVKHVLSDWRTYGDEKRIIFPSEYGFFSLIHGTFNPIIESALTGREVFFNQFVVWVRDGRSFDLWFDPVDPDYYFPHMNINFENFKDRCVGIDDKDAHASLVRFVAISELMTIFLSTVKKEIVELASERKKILNWNDNDKVIALHVRRGDSCSEFQMNDKKRTCDDLTTYMDDVKRMSEKYDIHKIFLMSDGGNYIFNQTFQYPEYEWMFVPKEGNVEHEGSIETWLKDHIIDGEREGLEMLVDFLTFVSADAFVGKFTSNVFRAAVEYKSGLMKARVPYISLDAPWCFCFLCHGTIETGYFTGEKFYC